MTHFYLTALATALLTATTATAQTAQRPRAHAVRVTAPQAQRANIQLHAVANEANTTYTPTVDTLISQQPAGTLHDNYYRTGTCFVNSMGYVQQDVVRDGILSRVVEAQDGKTLYIYNPLCAYSSKAWIKATRTVGDTIEVKLPQYIVHYDNAEQGDDAYLFKLKPIKGDEGYTFIPDDDQTAKFIWRNDTLTFINTTKDSKILGMCTPQGEWSGNGDYVWTQAPYTGTLTQPTDPTKAQTYAMEYVESGQGYGRIKRVVFEGDQVYVAGIDPQLPNAWIKGTREGDQITFNGHQFLGIDPKTETFRFFEPAATDLVTEGDDSYVDIVGLADDITLTYDANEQSFETDVNDILLVNQGYRTLNQAYTYEGPIFSPWTEEPATPDPVEQLTYEPYDATAGYGLITFIPSEYLYDAEAEEYDQLLNADKMYFNIYIDGQLQTFRPTDYWALDSAMTNIPFDFTDNYDFIPYYGMYNIRTHFAQPCTHIGVQVVYAAGGEVRKSRITYIGGDGNEVDDATIAGITNAQAGTAASSVPTTYYDLQGRRVMHPHKGLYITNTGRKVTF